MQTKEPRVLIAEITLTPQQEFPLDAAPLSVEDIWDFVVRSWELNEQAAAEMPEELRSALYDTLNEPKYIERTRLTLDAWLHVFAGNAAFQFNDGLDQLVQSAFTRITSLLTTMTPRFRVLLGPHLNDGYQVSKVNWSPGLLIVQFTPA